MAKKSKIPLSSTSSVLFASFSKWHNGRRLPTNGSIEPLRDFLVPRINKLVIIDQLHPGGEGVMPKIEVYKDHSKKFKSRKSSKYLYLLEPLLNLFNNDGTQIIFKIRDFLSVIDWSLRDKTHFNYFIGLESINAAAGILLRRFGRVDNVVYYVSDYSPFRYSNKLFNYIYLTLDRFAATHSDFIWDVSPAMQKARLKMGLDPLRSAKVINVANGLYPGQIKTNPISKIKKYDLVYMGTLGAENGPDIAIKALDIVCKKFKDAKLHIIGGTDKDFVWLGKIIENLNLQKSVIFHGFIESSIEMSKTIRSCAIGLAPYKNIPGSIRLYADAGKIRAYCAAGLPVISSQVPPLGAQVASMGGAIIAHDDPKSFSGAILKMFADKKLYSDVKRKAYEYAKGSTWENTFYKAFEQM